MSKLNASYLLSKYKSYSFLVLFVIFLLVLTQFLGFDGLYGQDSYEYLRYSKALENFLKSGEHPGGFFWPILYPLTGSFFSFLGISSHFSLLMISSISYIISGLYLKKTISFYFQKTSNSFLYIILFFFLSPYILRNGVTIMSDMLAVCFIILSLYNHIAFKKNKTYLNFYGFTLFFTCAIMTRYASFVILVPFGIEILLLLKFKRKVIFHLFISSIILFSFSFLHFWLQSSNYGNFLNHEWLSNWSFLNLFSQNFVTIDGVQNYNLPNIFHAFSSLFDFRFIFLGSFLLFVTVIKKTLISNSRSILISFFLYSVFLGGIPFQNKRFLLLSFPLVIIVFYPAFCYLLNLVNPKKIRSIIFIICISFQMILISLALKPVIKRNLFEKKLVALLTPYEGKTLYSFEVDIAIKGRGLSFDYHNMYSYLYNDFHSGDLVFFHPSKFETQWQGKNPIKNWNYIKENYKLETLIDGPEGWQLYKILNTE